MKVAVIGAGVAGLVNARVLLDLGLEVIVYESRQDVGGVWSGQRGYPGLRTQNDKDSYSFSDLRMPADVPQHPERRHVQAYLADYARLHGVEPMLRLGTTVTGARWDGSSDCWRLTVDHPGGRTEERADWLIVANGICSTPQRPRLQGEDLFAAAGGRAVDASALGDAASFRDLRVVVVGVGKSGADIAVAAVADGAASVSVVARGAGWKLPYRLGRVPFQRLVNTRLGEHLLWAPWRSPAGRALRAADGAVRVRFGRALEQRVRVQQRLDRRGLVPSSPVGTVTHLATAGFFEGVDDGRIDLRLGRSVGSLTADDDVPTAVLDDGTRLPADLLVLATGFDQDVSVFDDRIRGLLLGQHGEMSLVRHTLPPRVPRLAFAGWTNSFRSPVASEIQALWIAAHLHGLVTPHRRRAQDVHEFQLTRRRAEQRGRPQFSAGASILDQDAWLRESGLRLPRRTVLREVLRPLDPADYADLHRQLRARVAHRATAVGSPRHGRPEPGTDRLPRLQAARRGGLDRSRAAASAREQPAAQVEADLNRFLDEYAGSPTTGLHHVLRRPTGALAAVGLARRLPTLEVITSSSAEGRAVQRELSRGQGRLRTPLHRVSAAVAVPADLDDYTSGASKQTLRRKVRAARQRGITWSRVVDRAEQQRLVELADRHERWNERVLYRAAVPSNADLFDYDLWLVATAADGTPLLLSVTPVDDGVAALRYFRTLVDSRDATLARYLVSQALVGELHRRGVHHLVDTTISLHLTPGLRHFQRMVGFRLLRLRVTRRR